MPEPTTFVQDGCKITRFDESTPTDNQERCAYVIGIRAHRAIFRVIDRYNIVLAVAPGENDAYTWAKEYIASVFASLLKLTDLANWAFTCDPSQRDLARLKGWKFGDYVWLLQEFNQRIRTFVQHMRGWVNRTRAQDELIDMLDRLPADCDHEQAEFERAGYHLDIALRIDEEQPDFGGTPPSVPVAPGPPDLIDPEPHKKKKVKGKKRAVRTAKKKRR